MHSTKIGLLLLFTALFLPSMAVAQRCELNEIQKILAADGEADDYFGVSVAISGDTAVVGSFYEDEVALNAGAVYVYTNSGEVWTQQQKLTPSDGYNWVTFGASVAIYGDTIVVGAPHEANYTGVAYVFERDSGVWTEVVKLQASTSRDWYDYFGASVGINAHSILVGAYNWEGAGVTDGGAVFVYEPSGLTWVETDILTSSYPSSLGAFGNSISIDGDSALIGSSATYTGAGCVYAFDWDGVEWSESQQLRPADPYTEDFFGISVSHSGASAVIGSYYDDDMGDNSGSAYIFDRSGGTWVEQAKLTGSDGHTDARFGSSVALAGDVAVVGSYALNGSGGAYVYKRSGSTWVEEAMLVSSDIAAGDSLGASVAIWGTTALCGTTGDDDLGSVSGSAYLFDAVCPDQSTLLAEMTCTPSSGTLPFNFQMTVTLSNQFTGQLRRLAAKIHFTLAGGSYFAGWRAGYTNLNPGASYILTWNQHLPALGTLVGDNMFQLTAEDVTPAPYNQPPYPPAGDTDTASCTVTGVAP